MNRQDLKHINHGGSSDHIWSCSEIDKMITRTDPMIVKIDVSGLNVIQNNSYNFLISGKNPLNLHGRILESGISVFKIKF